MEVIAKVITKMYIQRRKLNFTQVDVALAVGVTQAEISMLETKTITNTRVKGLMGKIAKYLEMKEEDLLLEVA